MKNLSNIGIILFLLSSSLFAQTEKELSVIGGDGYLSGETGHGAYQYFQSGINFKGDHSLIGPFVLLVNADMNFNNYHYTAKEAALGVNYSAWGENDDYEGCYWLSPSLKYFSDYGNGGPNTDAWQKDFGFYGLFGANLTSKNNGWFSSYKATLIYQQPFISKKTGLAQAGDLVQKIDFKAANKSYIKFQFESAAKRFALGQKARFEPKLVVGYLYDGGSLKSYWEFGSGVAFSFIIDARYYEAFNLQYRARFDYEFATARLDVIELNLDFVNLWKILN